MCSMVSGCGISAICETKESMLFWIDQIIRHGGVPVVIQVTKEVWS